MDWEKWHNVSSKWLATAAGQLGQSIELPISHDGFLVLDIRSAHQTSVRIKATPDGFHGALDAPCQKKK